MYRYVSETLVSVVNPSRITNEISIKSVEYCRSIIESCDSTLLNFYDARATMTPLEESLHIRVEARDMVTFYGVRTFLQGHIFTRSAVPNGVVEWQSSSTVPFTTVRDRIGSR